MRFKKLRIFVAVALIIFILIIANTIVFGYLQNKQDAQSKLSTPIDSRKSSSAQPSGGNSASISQTTQSSQASEDTSASQTSTAVQNPAVIYHTSTRTRAS